jgi:hypothetical protein
MGSKPNTAGVRLLAFFIRKVSKEGRNQGIIGLKDYCGAGSIALVGIGPDAICTYLSAPKLAFV